MTWARSPKAAIIQSAPRQEFVGLGPAVTNARTQCEAGYKRICVVASRKEFDPPIPRRPRLFTPLVAWSRNQTPFAKLHRLSQAARV